MVHPDIVSVGTDRPIGVFDSGLGGLSVVRAICEMLPAEKLVYLGDTARVPYGTRSETTVLNYAKRCAARLEAEGIKLLVVACNTVSAIAMEELSRSVSVPVIGVIEPGAYAAVNVVGCRRVVVIGTPITVSSRAYENAISRLCLKYNFEIDVRVVSAPLLVPLVEEGWLEGRVPELAIEKYLRLAQVDDPDVLMLGCTHYPLLRSTVERVAAQVWSRRVIVVDSAVTTAESVACMVGQSDDRVTTDVADLRLMVTDVPGAFGSSAERFLGDYWRSARVELIDL